MIQNFEYIDELVQKNKELFNTNSKIKLRKKYCILTELIEKELQKYTESEENEKITAFEDFLLREYKRRGFSEENQKNLLESVKKSDKKSYKKIILKKAREFEENKSFSYAAEEYVEAKEYAKAAKSWIYQGNATSSSLIEFLLAAECLIKAGHDEKSVYLKMSDEMQPSIEKNLKDEQDFILSSDAFSNFGECLFLAGKYDESLEAFLHVVSDEHEYLYVKKEFYARRKDWKKAAEAQKIIAKRTGYNGDYEQLAAFYELLGKKKKQAEALWFAEKFLEAAKLADSLEPNNDFYFKAGKKYEKKIECRKEFFNFVWKKFKHEFDFETKDSQEERIQITFDYFKMIYSAYGLKASFEPNKELFLLNNNEHEKRGAKVYYAFLEEKKQNKKSKLKNLLSKTSLFKIVEHAVHQKKDIFEIKEFVRKSFVGMPRKWPVLENLSQLAKVIWESCKEGEISSLGYDPVEMTARSFEQGKFFKEAKKWYLKANLLEDAKRIDKMIVSKKKKN